MYRQKNLYRFGSVEALQNTTQRRVARPKRTELSQHKHSRMNWVNPDQERKQWCLNNKIPTIPVISYPPPRTKRNEHTRWQLLRSGRCAHAKTAVQTGRSLRYVCGGVPGEKEALSRKFHGPLEKKT